MDELLIAARKIRPFIGAPSKFHKWVWSLDEVQALDKVIEAAADCVEH